MTSFLISFLFRSVILGGLGIAVIWLLRRKSASLQHAIAVGTVSAMIALPLLSCLLPTHVLEGSRVPNAFTYITATRINNGTLATHSMAHTARFDWPDIAAALWLTVVVLLLLRLIAGFLFMRGRLTENRELRIGRNFCAVEDSSTKIPMMIWMGRSLVFLPKSWSSWQKDHLDLVLAHEEAHIHRGDWFTQVFVRLATIAMWPNPIAHILAKASSALAEQAADDLVLASGVDPAVYASSFIEVARGAVAAPAYAVPMAANSNISRRIEMILDKNRQRMVVSPRTLVAVGLAMAVVSVPLACSALKQTRAIQPVTPSFGAKGSLVGAAIPVMLINQKDVQADLGFGTDQIQAVNELIRQYRQDRRSLRSGNPAAAGNSSLKAITGKFLGQLDAVLNSNQRVRLNQIFIQWRKYDAVLEPDVQAALGVTPTQKIKISVIAIRYQMANKDLSQRMSSGSLSPSALQPIQQTLNTNYEANLGKVLTSAQAAKLEAMGGNPFNGHIMGTIWSNAG